VRSGILRPRAPRLALVLAACLPEGALKLSEIRDLYLSWGRLSMKKWRHETPGPLKWRRKGTGIVTFAWSLNFDHLRAKIAEQHGPERILV